MKKNYAVFGSLFGASAALLIGALYLIFLYVPTEREMGVVQRIFYFHVPVAWVAMLAYVVLFIGSILYLWKGEARWDIMASSSAEVGIVFTTMFLISGSIWARPIWGVWWTWEPRLTATLVLWLIYFAYFLVRSFASEEYRGAMFAAVVSIVGFVDIPIIILATTLWRGMHPGAIIFQGGLAPPMLLTLIISVFAFTFLFLLLLMQRVSMRNFEIEIRMLKELHDSG